MPVSLKTATNPETSRQFLIVEQKDVIDLLQVLRMIKQGAPALFDQVAREFILPNRMNGLLLPGETNGHDDQEENKDQPETNG